MLTIISAMGLPAVNHLLPIKTSEVKKPSSFAAEPAVQPGQSFEDLLKQQEADRKIKEDYHSEPREIHEYKADKEPVREERQAAKNEEHTPKNESFSKQEEKPVSEDQPARTENQSMSQQDQGKTTDQTTLDQSGKKETMVKTDLSEKPVVTEQALALKVGNEKLEKSSEYKNEHKNQFNAGLKKAGSSLQPANANTENNESASEVKHGTEPDSKKDLKEFIKTENNKQDIPRPTEKLDSNQSLGFLDQNKGKTEKLTSNQETAIQSKQNAIPEKNLENAVQQTKITVKDQAGKLEQHRENLQSQNQNPTPALNQNQHNFTQNGNLNRDQEFQQGQRFNNVSLNEKSSSESNHRSISSESNFIQGLQDKIKTTTVSRETMLDESTRRQVQQQIDAAWNRARFQLRDQKNVTMNTSIYPKEMGRIQLSLSLIDGLLQARFVVDNETVQKEVMDKMQQMAAELSNQGMKLSSFDVDLRQNQENQSDQLFNLNQSAKKAGIQDYQDSAFSMELSNEGVTYA